MSETQEQYGNGAEKRLLTAVEWLVEMVSKMGYVSTDIFEQAKTMEKEQREEAKHEGYKEGWDEGANYVGSCIKNQSYNTPSP